MPLHIHPQQLPWILDVMFITPICVSFYLYYIEMQSQATVCMYIDVILYIFSFIWIV